MSNDTLFLTPEIYQYLQTFSLRESSTLAELRQETNKTDAAVMMTSPEQVQLMALLIKLMKAKRVLEIGTFTGHGTLAMAEALPEDGKVITCDLDNRWCYISHDFWQQSGLMGKIEQRLGNAVNTVKQLLTEGYRYSFDFIFIDADKENYDHYYETGLKLLRSGGLIAIDNVLWGGAVADEEDQRPSTVALRELNKKLLSDKRVCLSMVPIGDGLTLALKR